MTTDADIIVVTDCTEGSVDPSFYDVVAFSQRLKKSTKGTVQVWAVGETVDDSAVEMARLSGFDVTVLCCNGLSHYHCEAYRKVLAPLIQQILPAYVCAAHTSCGWEWAPAVAAEIGAGCICGVDGIEGDKEGVCFTKDRYGGKVKGRYVSGAATTILTVQPGCFPFEPLEEDGLSGKVTRQSVACDFKHTQFMGIGKAVSDTTNISEASVVVAAGNGVGDRVNMEWVHRLAGLFPKAAVAGSRIVCDRGWLGYERQVGVTGATVTPTLYIACGISGASQHMAGMRGSEYVVAINTDARAPIVSEADLYIVEDLTRFIPLVVETWEKIKETDDSVS